MNTAFQMDINANPADFTKQVYEHLQLVWDSFGAFRVVPGCIAAAAIFKNVCRGVYSFSQLLAGNDLVV